MFLWDVSFRLYGWGEHKEKFFASVRSSSRATKNAFQAKTIFVKSVRDRGLGVLIRNSFLYSTHFFIRSFCSIHLTCYCCLLRCYRVHLPKLFRLFLSSCYLFECECIRTRKFVQMCEKLHVHWSLHNNFINM